MDFTHTKENIFKQLGDAKTLVLASSASNRVSARMMSFIFLNEKCYFQTDRTLLKSQQISENNKIALCADNISIEGYAIDCGSMMDAKNSDIALCYKTHHKSSYNAYSHMKNNVVYECVFELITVWSYRNGEPLRTFIDFKNKRAWEEFYDHSQ